MDQLTLIKDSVRKLLTEMQEQTLKAGIDPKRYNSLLLLVNDDEMQDEERLSDLHNWLDEVRRGAYDDVLRIWERHKPATWANFDMLGVYLNEHKVLDQKRMALRKAWKGAPRGKQQKRQEEDSAEQDQLGEAG